MKIPRKLIDKVVNKLKRPSIWDRDFTLKFRKIADEEINRKVFEEDINKYFSSLSQGLSLEKINEARIVLQRFYEFFDRVMIRYAEIHRTEWEIYYWERLREKRPLKDIQTDFVNATESFHQEIYANISAFIKLLSHLAPKKFRDKMPSNSVSNFLKFLSRENASLNEFILNLEKSLDLRVKYIDHSNLQKAHDWWTFSNFDGRVYVIYFEGRNRGESIDLSPALGTSFKIMTPFSAEVFFVVPHHSIVLNSLVKIVLSSFSFSKKNEGVPALLA